MTLRQQVNLPRSQRRPAFTLVELLVSVAIALILILGINEVFKISAQTVGTGQAFSEVTRDERVAHFSVYTDVLNALTTSQPALLISSQSVIAFRTQQDASNEPSGVPGTITINGTPQTVSNALASSRNFRIDTLGFFASGDLYQRQTGDPGQFVSTTTSSNAYIWYGHVLVPNNNQAQNPTVYGTLPPTAPPQLGQALLPPASPIAGQWFGPGWPDNSTTVRNDNNRFAADWILGRVAMLFIQPPISGTTNYLTAGASGNVLGSDAIAQDSSPIYSSRYDVVGSSVTQFNTAAATYLKTTPALPNGFRTPMFFRYQANPFPIKPLSAATMAGVAPVFLRHCSQFIVEYAGDYLTQDNNPYNADGSANLNYGNVGTVTNPTTKVVAPVNGAQGDGVVDFVIDPTSKANNPTNPGLWTRKIRWYGFPRDTNGDGAIDLQDDVVPLRDVLQAAVPNGAGQAPTAATAMAPWEAFNDLAIPSGGNYVGYTNTDAQYLCSWGSETVYPLASGTSNGLPRMLRITLALDDPNGRLAAPQIYEYVIDLGAQQ